MREGERARLKQKIFRIDFIVDTLGPLFVNYFPAGKGGGPDMIDLSTGCEVAET
jgi:D-serine dehydratase